MNYQDYIRTELLILVPVLYFMGIGLKKSKLPDKWIPVALGVMAILLSTMWIMSTGAISGVEEIVSALFTAITQGVLVAGASVYANQIYIQANKEE